MNIFFVGLAKCPYANRACDIRLDSFAELFVKCGHEVMVLNRYSPYCNNTEDELRYRSYRIKEFIKHGGKGGVGKLLYLCSVLRELCFLINFRIRHGNDVLLHIYSGHYLDILFYHLISRLCGYKVVYQYVEYRMEEKRKNPYHRLNAWLVDRHGMKLCDGVIPISYFLKDRALEVNPKVKYVIGPPICDFSRFDQYRTKKENVVLYCGSAGYFEVVKLVVDSFNQSKLALEYSLELIISGSDKQIEKIKTYAPNAIIRTKLPYDELIRSYNRSRILMIPLRDNVKDISRFPNKICEYAASKGVIVTTCFGEPARFFQDKKSAMIASSFTVDAIRESLDWLEANQQKMERIGENGFQVGTQAFSLDSYIDKFKTFLDEV